MLTPLPCLPFFALFRVGGLHHEVLVVLELHFPRRQQLGAFHEPEDKKKRDKNTHMYNNEARSAKDTTAFLMFSPSILL